MLSSSSATAQPLNFLTSPAASLPLLLVPLLFINLDSNGSRNSSSQQPMSNLATKEGGASVTSATCQDDRHPASAIIDGNEKTFFYTTGLFPQEIVIAFNKEVTPANIHIVSRHRQSSMHEPRRRSSAVQLLCFH